VLEKRTRGKSECATREIVKDYLALCRSPTRDLCGWLDELDRTAGVGVGGRRETTPRKDQDHDSSATENLMAEHFRLRGNSLPELRGGLDADGQGGRNAHGLLARPRAGAGRYDCLRPVRVEGVGGRTYRAPLAVAAFRQAARAAAQRPRRAFFMAARAMCEAQRLDYKAACHGKMTWGEYCRKWENGLAL
jgi:hypothetical protein